MLTPQEKKVLSNIVRREVGGCEICKADVPLIPHRIQRGNKGGKYIPRNIEMVCERCHRLIHYNEQGCRQR